MAIVYRVTNAPNTGSSVIKNSALTYAEGDGNFAVLENLSSSFLAFSSSYNTGSFTGSFTGNGSGLTGIISASYAATASSANDFLVRGTLTAQTIVVQTITSSVEFVTGSTHFGSIIGNTHQFTGSVGVSGSITVNNGVINNLTASWAISSSYASNSASGSYANNSTSASYALTSSYSNNSTSASYALTASYSNNSTSASYANNSTSASYSNSSTSASYANNSTSASYANNSTSASYANNSTTASYVIDGITNANDTYTGTPKITDIITLTAAEYSGIGSPSSNTLYVII